MKAIVIDNNIIEHKLFDKLDCMFIRNSIPSQIKEDLRRRALTIQENTVLPQSIRLNSEDVTIFINVDSKIENSLRINQPGIEVLKWLRIKYKISNPIILYSFLNTHQLLKLQPDNLILCSEGCYFVQLPNNFINVIRKMSNGHYKGIQNWESLKIFLKSSFSIENIRHEDANWWGLLQIFNTHNYFLKINGKVSLNEKDVISVETSKRINSLNSLAANFIYKNDLYQKDTHVSLTTLSRIPKIIYIDDMANIGWSNILQHIIYGKYNSEFFKTINPKPEQKINDLWNIFTKIIFKDKFKPDCVLLDLRLYNEKGKIPIDELSGSQLLKKIKSAFPSLPVIMFTASNKSKSLKELSMLGCEYLWTKEGVDEMCTNQDSIDNYIQLLNYIEKSVNKFDDVTDRKLFETELLLSQLQSNEFLEINKFFDSFDVILTDTNIWINQKGTKNIHKALYILINYCFHKGKPYFIVPDKVFDEIIRVGKEKLDKDFIYPNGIVVKAEKRKSVRKIARWVEPILQKYYDDNKVKKVVPVNDENHGREKYNKRSYADKYFYDQIIPELIKEYNILFISDDRNCKENVKNVLTTITNKKDYHEYTSDDLTCIINF